MSPISCHVLDTALGCPAAGVPVVLARLGLDGEWQILAAAQTDTDGRAKNLAFSQQFLAGTYRVSFDTATYLRATQRPVFFPRAEVVFVVEHTSEHYHIPLLLSPFGYSTYRGS